MAQVLKEADRNGVTVPWAIPADWQLDRSIFEVRLPSRHWWVIADHADTLEALANLASPLAFLVSSDIEGEDRSTTTQIAQAIREITLDDSSDPLGIEYRSKTLMGRCWAYWDRRADLRLSPGQNDLAQLTSSNVGPDPDFHWVAGYYRLPTR